MLKSFTLSPTLKAGAVMLHRTIDIQPRAIPGEQQDLWLTAARRLQFAGSEQRAPVPRISKTTPAWRQKQI
jgi:hypothetical protein